MAESLGNSKSNQKIIDPTLHMHLFPGPSLEGIPLGVYQDRILEITNNIRAHHGLQPLIMKRILTEVARRQVEYLGSEKNISRRGHHQGPNGDGIGARVRAIGYKYKYAAENVGRKQKSPQHVMQKLMESPGHRKNILNEHVTEIGIYVIRGINGHLYWGQVFAKPKGIKQKSHKSHCMLK